MQNDLKNFDWEGLIKKLPVEKTNESRAKRKELWNAMDMNGNGFLSLAEFDRGVLEVLNLPDIFKQKRYDSLLWPMTKKSINSCFY